MSLLKNKKIFGIAVLLVLAALVYYVWSSAGGATASLTESGSETSPISQEILSTLNSLHTIKLDANKSIFTDPVFVSLTDYSVALPPQPSGRRNPFAPVGVSSTASSTTTPLAP